MTPEPPSSSDKPDLPPRHRPTLGNLSQDTTEMDLWAFDDDIELPDVPVKPRTGEAKRNSGKGIPAQRDKAEDVTREPGGGEPTKLPTQGAERIRMDVSKPRPKVRNEGVPAGSSKPGVDFDDLENWEDAPLDPEIGDMAAGEVPIVLKSMEPGEPVVEAAAAVEQESETAPAPLEVPASPELESDDELSPVRPDNPTPISLRPHLGLTKIERIGLIALLVILLLGGGAVYMYSLKRLPTETVKAEATDFPIKGNRISIESAYSFWRAPVTDGPNPDKFRLGTQLLPVLEMDLSGGPAVLRVHFRDEDHAFVGDAVTYQVRESGKVRIPATAGFDDSGMHAAYRTGQSKPWTIEVFEAPSSDVSGGEFRKLFEMNVSTDRR